MNREQTDTLIPPTIKKHIHDVPKNTAMYCVFLIGKLLKLKAACN